MLLSPFIELESLLRHQKKLGGRVCRAVRPHVAWRDTARRVVGTDSGKRGRSSDTHVKTELLEPSNPEGVGMERGKYRPGLKEGPD